MTKIVEDTSSCICAACAIACICIIVVFSAYLKYAVNILTTNNDKVFSSITTLSNNIEVMNQNSTRDHLDLQYKIQIANITFSQGHKKRR